MAHLGVGWQKRRMKNIAIVCAFLLATGCASQSTPDEEESTVSSESAIQGDNGNGTTLSRTIINKLGQKKECAFNINAYAGSNVRKEITVMLPIDGVTLPFRNFSVGPSKPTPNGVFASLGKVHALRKTYSESAGAGTESTVWRTSYQDSNSQGSESSYILRRAGDVVGRIVTPETEIVTAYIDLICGP